VLRNKNLVLHLKMILGTRMRANALERFSIQLTSIACFQLLAEFRILKASSAIEEGLDAEP